MKTILSLCTACLLASASFAQPNPTKKVSPSELASVVVDALEELRTKLTGKKLTFKDANLEVSAVRSFAGGASLDVWVIEASVDVTKETTTSLSFQLSEPLKAAEKETIILAAIEAQFSNPASSNKSLNAMEKSMLKGFYVEKEDVAEIEKSTTYASVMDKFKRDNKRRKDAYAKAKEAIVDSVEKAIVEYEIMKTKFGKVCFDASVNFSVSVEGEGTASFWKIVGAKGGAGTEHSHSLTLTFGDCE